MNVTKEPSRPISLSASRAYSVLPTYSIDPEWERKLEAGELPEGLMGMRGMFSCEWPDEELTAEEARYVLALHDQGSFRWLAAKVLDGDSNQIHGSDLVAAAKQVLAEVTS